MGHVLSVFNMLFGDEKADLIYFSFGLFCEKRLFLSTSLSICSLYNLRIRNNQCHARSPLRIMFSKVREVLITRQFESLQIFRNISK